MLSSRSDLTIVKIYGIGLASLLLTGMMLFHFYNSMQQENVTLAKQNNDLLLDKVHYIDFQKNKTHGETEKNLLSQSALCGNATLLKQKIIFWVNQSQAQLVAIHFGTSIAVSIIGTFSQDMSLLIALANTRIIFDLNAIELLTVKNGIELRLDVTRDTVCN